ncbi:MAG: hypothetical protein E6Q97_09510 [Desulfurellales bacterium]|nr:MAG: hypothetical protein E6Q97_09510 [Desulfurellales bacterium]
MAHSFKDAAGRDWQVHVTVGTIKRVRDSLQVDLGRLFDDQLKPLDALLSDPVKLVDVLYVAVKPDADRLGVTDAMFGESLIGDVLERAGEALVGAAIDFQPNAEWRKVLTSTVAQARGYRAAAADAMLARLQSSDPVAEVKRMVELAESASAPKVEQGS